MRNGGSVARYDAGAREKAYVLYKVQQLPIVTVVEKMQAGGYPTFGASTLCRWAKSGELNWDVRYRKYCEEIAAKNDTELVKQATPIVDALREIREKLYDQLRKAIEKDGMINEKNIGLVLSSFVKMADLEHKMTGGAGTTSSPQQVVGFIIMVLEKDPVIGPHILTRKAAIEDAVFEMMVNEK